MRGGLASKSNLLALAIGEAQAREIGAAFGQKAIVVGRLGEPARLVWVQGAKGCDGAKSPGASLRRFP